MKSKGMFWQYALMLAGAVITVGAFYGLSLGMPDQVSMLQMLAISAGAATLITTIIASLSGSGNQDGDKKKFVWIVLPLLGNGILNLSIFYALSIGNSHVIEAMTILGYAVGAGMAVTLLCAFVLWRGMAVPELLLAGVPGNDLPAESNARTGDNRFAFSGRELATAIQKPDEEDGGAPEDAAPNLHLVISENPRQEIAAEPPAEEGLEEELRASELPQAALNGGTADRAIKDLKLDVRSLFSDAISDAIYPIIQEKLDEAIAGVEASNNMVVSAMLDQVSMIETLIGEYRISRQHARDAIVQAIERMQASDAGLEQIEQSIAALNASIAGKTA